MSGKITTSKTRLQLTFDGGYLQEWKWHGTNGNSTAMIDEGLAAWIHPVGDVKEISSVDEVRLKDEARLERHMLTFLTWLRLEIGRSIKEHGTVEGAKHAAEHDEMTHGRKKGAGRFGPEDPRSYDSELAARHEKVAKLNDAAMKNGHNTDQQYDHNPDGTWSDERKVHHDAILAEFEAENAHVPTDGKAIIMGGGPGSGKTFTIKSEAGQDALGVDQKDYITLNPDNFKQALLDRGLGPKKGTDGLKDGEISSFLHEESSYLAKRAAERAIAKNQNVMWDITMSSPRSVTSRINALTDRKKPYHITQVFIETPLPIAMRQAVKRYKGPNNDFSGRFVNLDHMKSGWPKFKATFNDVKPLADRWVHFYNDGSSAPRVFASGP